MIRHTLLSVSTRQVVLALTLGALAGSAFPQTPAAAAAASAAKQGDMAAATAPHVMQQNGVSYVSGGIADEGQAKAKDLGRDMGLHLVFARASGGNYMADIAVTIADKAGKTVFELPASDPLLYVKLQPGSYKVTAKADGKSQERMVEVPAKGTHTETMRW